MIMDNLNNTIESIVSPLTAVYNKIEEKGGEIPAEKNMKNLGAAIRSIPDKPPTPTSNWGILYTSDHPEGIELQTETDWLELATFGSTAAFTINGKSIPITDVTGFEFGSRPTTIKSWFLYGCKNLTYLGQIPSSITKIDYNFLAGCSSFNMPISFPDGITETPGGFLLNGSSFNSLVTLPNSITTIDQGFLRNCANFNQPLNLPPNLTTISTNFMSGCTSFNQSLNLPSTLTEVKEYFMSNCNNFIGPLVVNATNCAYRGYDHDLATGALNAPMYSIGVTLLGAGAAALKAVMPNRIDSPYRKLMLG